MKNTGKGVALGLVLSLAMPVPGQVGDATPLILAFLRTTLIEMLLEQFGFMKKGTESVVRQEAAGAIGVQAALKQHAQVTAGAVGQASSAELKDRNERMFSIMGSINIDGKRVSIGSTAPSGCKQIGDATFMRRARPRVADIFDRIADAAVAWNRAPDGASKARDTITRDVNQRGRSVYDPSWVTDPVMTQAQTEAAELSIKYTYAPPPIPAALVARTPAARELQQDMIRLQEQALLPQKVMSRQVAMRTPTEGERSMLSTIQGWGKEAEDPVMAAALGAKTDTGVLREIAITAKRQLAVDAELLQTQAETNALLAMLVQKQIGEEMKETARAMRAAAETKQ